VSADADRLAAALRAGLPPGCRFAIEAIDGSHQVREQDRPPGRASSRRLHEFAAGRAAARRALAWLGTDAPALPCADDRSPRWPAGIVGSIAHGGALALAVVAHQQQVSLLGVDLEPWRMLDDDVVDLILTGGERGHGLAGDPLPAFCAKEAVFKASWPRLRRFLEFAEVELAPTGGDPAAGWRRYRVVEGPVAPLALAIAVTRSEGYQCALAWRAGDRAPAADVDAGAVDRLAGVR
jgi:4'-phosphopantetheinyl transferase EntD